MEFPSKIRFTSTGAEAELQPAEIKHTTRGKVTVASIKNAKYIYTKMPGDINLGGLLQVTDSQIENMLNQQIITIIKQ